MAGALVGAVGACLVGPAWEDRGGQAGHGEVGRDGDPGQAYRAGARGLEAVHVVAEDIVMRHVLFPIRYFFLMLNIFELPTTLISILFGLETV